MKEKCGIATDDWKLAIFERCLKKDGFIIDESKPFGSRN